MASQISRTAGTRIGDIPETIKAGGTIPLLRISATDQVTVTEAVIDFDVKLII